MIPVSGSTRVFPVIGWPVEQVKATGLFNAYFAKHSIDAVSIPLSVKPEHCQEMIKQLMSAMNVGGIFVTIPHKPAAATVADVVTLRAQIAGASNAVYKNEKGQLVADLLDGEGFIRGLALTLSGEDFDFSQAGALIVGCGGVGSAVAASLAEHGIRSLSLVDVNAEVTSRLAQAIRQHYPAVQITEGNDLERRYDIAVNGTPLGMQDGDALPFALEQMKEGGVVADCGMKIEMTALLRAAQARGLRIQRGREMLLEQSPLYLERFGWSGATAKDFRDLGVL